MQRAMVGRMTNSLAENAAATFSRESDPVLAADAMPFALKTLDMLALDRPQDPHLQFLAGRSYVQYSAAFLDWQARKLSMTDFEASEALRQRSKRLHLRGRDYLATALELNHPGAMARLAADPATFLDRCKPRDVAVLFWLGTGWAAAIAADPADMHELANLGLIEAIMRRCLALEPDYDDGSLHEFFLALETTRAAAAGSGTGKAEVFYDQAVAASKGRRASPHVLMATTVMVQQQNAAGYRALLEKALAMDLDADPDLRLANAIAQDKARWYLEQMEDFILMIEPDDTP
jgi:predicted anti-sigma-YlaC factor YlaD